MNKLSTLLISAMCLIVLPACGSPSDVQPPAHADDDASLRVVPASFAGCEDAPDECAIGGNCASDRYYVIQNGGQCSSQERAGGRTAECWCCDGNSIAVQNGNGGYCETCPEPSVALDVNICQCPDGTLLDVGQDGSACGEIVDPPPPPKCDPACDSGFECVDGSCECPTSGNPECGGHPCAGTCDADEVCASDQCEPLCDPSQDYCDGSCVQTGNDDQHCGGCGQACASNEICNAGVCCSNGNCK